MKIRSRNKDKVKRGPWWPFPVDGPLPLPAPKSEEALPEEPASESEEVIPDEPTSESEETASDEPHGDEKPEDMGETENVPEVPPDVVGPDEC